MISKRSIFGLALALHAGHGLDAPGSRTLPSGRFPQILLLAVS
ncbi:MAG TPA: hypothetical protein VMY43_08100 [Methanothrix sp.]|nr:hypothetical protein [Methanothrix sp.]